MGAGSHARGAHAAWSRERGPALLLLVVAEGDRVRELGLCMEGGHCESCGVTDGAVGSRGGSSDRVGELRLEARGVERLDELQPRLLVQGGVSEVVAAVVAAMVVEVVEVVEVVAV